MMISRWSLIGTKGHVKETNWVKKTCKKSKASQFHSTRCFSWCVCHHHHQQDTRWNCLFEQHWRCVQMFFQSRKAFLFVGHNHIEVLLWPESNSDNKKQNLFWKILWVLCIEERMISEHLFCINSKGSLLPKLQQFTSGWDWHSQLWTCATRHGACLV